MLSRLSLHSVAVLKAQMPCRLLESRSGLSSFRGAACYVDAQRKGGA
jgi:hypothetical protein